MTASSLEIAGTRGRIVVHRWDVDDPRYVALISHGYGEHARRYDHVAERLNTDGAVVYPPDHYGHWRSVRARAVGGLGRAGRGGRGGRDVGRAAAAGDPRRGRPARAARPPPPGDRGRKGQALRREDLPRRPPRGVQRDQPRRGPRGPRRLP